MWVRPSTHEWGGRAYRQLMLFSFLYSVQLKPSASIFFCLVTVFHKSFCFNTFVAYQLYLFGFSLFPCHSQKGPSLAKPKKGAHKREGAHVVGFSGELQRPQGRGWDPIAFLARCLTGAPRLCGASIADGVSAGAGPPRVRRRAHRLLIVAAAHSHGIAQPRRDPSWGWQWRWAFESGGLLGLGRWTPPRPAAACI